ncbi:MAG: uroporphyrinogen-III synthase, partial [Synergistaceae bacterium]|nr:uroporphyrinogen-III synthase [Synergistaceae bacterium]
EMLQMKLLETMPAETPCAIIENGTTSKQRVIRTTLSQLYTSVVSNNIQPPAIIVTGKVASLNLSWRENLPLNGKRIIITRPEGRGDELALKLRDLGAEVIIMPTIRTKIIHGSLDDVNISGYDWIGFTSVTGVNALFELLSETGRDIREIGNAKISAIGQATKDALNAHGLRVDYMPEIFDGFHMAEGLSEFGGKILMFRSENGTPEINSVFMKYGIEAENICIYRTDYVKLYKVPELADIIIFTSSSTVKGFCANTEALREATALCIGKQTAEEAMKSGFTRIKVAEQAVMKALFEACINI